MSPSRVRPPFLLYSGRRQTLLEPVIGVLLIVEGVDLSVSRRAIHRDRFGERLVGIEPDRRAAVAGGPRLQLGEDASTYSETSRFRRDPQALQLGGVVTMEFDPAARHGFGVESRDEEHAGRRAPPVVLRRR